MSRGRDSYQEVGEGRGEGGAHVLMLSCGGVQACPSKEILL